MQIDVAIGKAVPDRGVWLSIDIYVPTLLRTAQSFKMCIKGIMQDHYLIKRAGTGGGCESN